MLFRVHSWFNGVIGLELKLPARAELLQLRELFVSESGLRVPHSPFRIQRFRCKASRSCLRSVNVELNPPGGFLVWLRA